MKNDRRLNCYAMSLPKAYQFCEKFGDKITTFIQLRPNFLANRAIYGVKYSRRLLTSTNKWNEWQNLTLVEEGYFSGLEPWLLLETRKLIKVERPWLVYPVESPLTFPIPHSLIVWQCLFFSFTVVDLPQPLHPSQGSGRMNSSCL